MNIPLATECVPGQLNLCLYKDDLEILIYMYPRSIRRLGVLDSVSSGFFHGCGVVGGSSSGFLKGWGRLMDRISSGFFGGWGVVNEVSLGFFEG